MKRMEPEWGIFWAWTLWGVVMLSIIGFLIVLFFRNGGVWL